jgi:hypothetical protein
MNRMLATLAVVLVAVGLVAAADEKKGVKPAKISPQLSAQLGAMFEKVDLNKDLFLDRDELAKAFRGPRAKAAPEAKPDDEKKDAKANPPVGPFPEDDFIKAWDKDSDNKISLAEFEHWGAKYDADMKKANNKAGNQNAWQQYWQRMQKAQQQPKKN